MGWADDKGRLLEWIAGGLLTGVVGLLCYTASGMAADIDSTKTDIKALQQQSDHAAGRSEINDQLLKEVRDDVKKLLERVPEH